MRRNQAPASVVSITSKGGPSVQHKFQWWQLGENLLTDPCSPFWAQPTQQAAWFPLRTLRWFLASSHIEGISSQVRGVCGLLRPVWPPPWTLAGLQRAACWGTDSEKQPGLLMALVSCAWSAGQAPGLSQPYHTLSWLVLKPLMPSSGQHRPLLEILCQWAKLQNLAFQMFPF